MDRARGIVWRADVVPMESAYPGFGEFVVLQETDHVNICKPTSQDDASYVKTLHFLQEISRSIRAPVGELDQDRADLRGSTSKP